MHLGPHNDLTDVLGIRVGHATRTEPGWLTGCTVVLADPSAVGGVSVRGAAPGTRETDLLDPQNLVDRVDAVVLSGGSAFGLSVADGVMAHLYAAGRGWPMGSPGQVVPIVPAAVLFDLGRGHDEAGWANHPGPDDGRSACEAATDGVVPQGTVGAGTGARAGGLKGGIGSASVVLTSGATVAALVAVNAVGSPIDLRTGEPYAARFALPGELDVAPVDPTRLAAFVAGREAEAAAARAMTGPTSEDDQAPVDGPRPGGATTIGVVATDLTLTKAGCAKLADLGHDGLARAIDPAHTAYDGDTLFALATGARPTPMHPLDVIELQQAAAACFTRAVGHALLAATSAGGMPSWSEALTAG